MAARITPFLPVALLVGDRFDNLSKAPRVTVPSVVVHGTDDDVIPFAMGKQLAAAIGSSRFEPIAGAPFGDRAGARPKTRNGARSGTGETCQTRGKPGTGVA